MPGLILASKGRITNPFGALNPPTAALKYHQGVDTGWGNGLTVYAPAAGYASARSSGGAQGTYGNYWWIEHDDGTKSVVAHLRNHIGASRYVQQREEIGVMGNTGTIAVHCHQEYIVNGVRVDPTKHLSSSSGGDVTPFPPTPPPLAEQLEGLEMETILIGIADGENRYKQGANKRFYALVYLATGYFIPITGATSANELVRKFGKPTSTTTLPSNEFNFDYADWERIVGSKYPYAG